MFLVLHPSCIKFITSVFSLPSFSISWQTARRKGNIDNPG